MKSKRSVVAARRPKKRSTTEVVAGRVEQLSREQQDAATAVREQRAAKRTGQLRAATAHLAEENARLTAENEYLLHLDDYTPAPMRIKPDRRRDPRGLNRCLPIALASDWHIEERVRPETVSFLNEYNPDIAAERAQKFFRNTLRLINMQRAGARIDEAVLWLGGDLITGYIHPELVEENYLSPIEAVDRAFDILVGGIQFLLAEGDFTKLHIPCSYGNHGRTTEKIRIASGARNSYEWGLYHRLRKHFAALKEPRAAFQVAAGYHQYVDIGDDIALRFHHGDAIRYAGGVGGVTVPLMKAIHNWNTAPREGSRIARAATCDFLGHFHQYFGCSRWVVNGSLIGWNPYAVQIRAQYEEPQQAFCMVDLDTTHGSRVIGHFPIRVI